MLVWPPLYIIIIIIIIIIIRPPTFWVLWFKPTAGASQRSSNMMIMCELQACHPCHHKISLTNLRLPWNEAKTNY